jgi:hypothetical protein
MNDATKLFAAENMIHELISAAKGTSEVLDAVEKGIIELKGHRSDISRQINRLERAIASAKPLVDRPARANGGEA